MNGNMTQSECPARGDVMALMAMSRFEMAGDEKPVSRAHINQHSWRIRNSYTHTPKRIKDLQTVGFQEAQLRRMYLARAGDATNRQSVVDEAGFRCAHQPNTINWHISTFPRIVHLPKKIFQRITTRKFTRKNDDVDCVPRASDVADQ